jgi:hypothetical protein
MNVSLPNRSRVRPTTAQRIAWITQALAKLTSARAELRRARCARAAALASQSIRSAAELRAYLESLGGGTAKAEDQGEQDRGRSHAQ